MGYKSTAALFLATTIFLLKPTETQAQTPIPPPNIEIVTPPHPESPLHLPHQTLINRPP